MPNNTRVDASVKSDRLWRFQMFNEDAGACTRCREQGLLFVDPVGGHARPILAKNPTAALGILVVGEAPNHADTFDPTKRYLTYDDETDPTGRFMRALLIDEGGLRADEIDDVLFTNATLCLPVRSNERHKPSARQLNACKPWLDRLIKDAEITVVVTMGATALDALNRVQRHGLTLKRAAGKLHAWRGVTILPLYHAGLLGRLSRNETEQRADMRALRRHLGR